MKPIKTKRDHEAMLKEIERLMGARRDSPEGDRLDVLVSLVEAYEARYFAIHSGEAAPAVTLPVEAYSAKRIREFDKEEAELAAVPSCKGKRSR